MSEEQPHKTYLEKLAGKYGKVYYPMATNETKLKEIVEKDFPGFSLYLDSHLNFTSNNHPEFHEHAPCTIRYAPNVVRLPKHPQLGSILECILVGEKNKKMLGHIRIGSEVVAWYLKDIPDKAAQLCGFRNKTQMIKELSLMYKKEILPNEALSLYSIDTYISSKK